MTGGAAGCNHSVIEVHRHINEEKPGWRFLVAPSERMTTAAEPGPDSVGCNVVRSFVQEGKFVGNFFTAAVSSSPVPNCCGLERGLSEAYEGEPIKPTQFFVFTWQLVKADS